MTYVTRFPAAMLLCVLAALIPCWCLGAEPLDRASPVRTAAAVTTSLQFQDATLAEATAAFNKHNVTQLVIADFTLSGVEIGGGFCATDPETFVAALMDLLDVQVVRIEHVILLYGAAVQISTGQSLESE